MPKKSPPRPEKRALRADAERNRRRLLEAAEAAFAEEGLGIPVDEVAKRAGLGVGTLYRHFPTKEALFEAILVDRMTRTATRLDAMVGASDAGAAFFSALEVVASESVRKKDFIHALGGVPPSSGAIDDAKARFRASVGALLARAQRAGAVRSDVSTSDVFALLLGVL